MSELDGVRSIEIKYETLTDVLSKMSSNPMAADFFSALLAEALDKGIPVIVKDEISGEVRQLIRDGDRFSFV